MLGVVGQGERKKEQRAWRSPAPEDINAAVLMFS